MQRYTIDNFCDSVLTNSGMRLFCQIDNMSQSIKLVIIEFQPYQLSVDLFIEGADRNRFRWPFTVHVFFKINMSDLQILLRHMKTLSV